MSDNEGQASNVKRRRKLLIDDEDDTQSTEVTSSKENLPITSPLDTNDEQKTTTVSTPKKPKTEKSQSSIDDMSGVLAPLPGHKVSAGIAFNKFFFGASKPQVVKPKPSVVKEEPIESVEASAKPSIKDEPSSDMSDVMKVETVPEVKVEALQVKTEVKSEIITTEVKNSTGKRTLNPFEMMMNKPKAKSAAPSKSTLSSDLSIKSEDNKEQPTTDLLGNSDSISSSSPSFGELGEDSYDPILHAGWTRGQKVPYSAIARMFQKCEDTTKRLKIISYVSDFFRSVIELSPSELLQCIYLCVNQVYPAFEGKELGIGDQILLKALAEACGSTLADVKDRARVTGDLGVVAEESRAKQRTLMRPNKLTVTGVFLKLREIADMTGSKSGEKKKDIIKQLLVSSQGHEARFLTRALQGNLRIHLALLTVLRALARALVLTPPTFADPSLSPDADGDVDIEALDDIDLSDEEEEEKDEDDGGFDKEGRKKAANPKLRSPTEIKIDEAHKRIVAAYNDCPSFEKLTDAITTLPLTKLRQKCSLTPGLPIKVMLGKPARGVMEVVKKFEGRKFTLEYKYDGERAQIHKLADGTFRIYSRHQENNTGKYPDIIQKLPTALVQGVESFIIDAEVVAWDPKEHKILPFQTLSTRKRKDVKEEDVEVQVLVFAFDLLYLNGKSFMRQPFEKRRDALHASFKPTPGIFDYAKFLDSTDPEDIDTFLQQAVADSCEGLMVKPLDFGASYVPDKRNWIKVKKDYLDGVGDTLDLVPLGAWYGKGKRTGTFGAFLMYCYNDSDNDEVFQSVVRIGTGFKDSDLDELTKLLTPHIIDSPPHHYVHSTQPALTPHVWFSPQTVWEVKCADLSISPEHKAAVGLVHESNGISIRFPRFLRLRPDKKPEHATSAEQIVDMYMAQSVVQNSGIASVPKRR